MEEEEEESSDLHGSIAAPGKQRTVKQSDTKGLCEGTHMKCLGRHQDKRLMWRLTGRREWQREGPVE